MYRTYTHTNPLPHGRFSAVWELLSTSFPPAELRVREEQMALLADRHYGLFLHEEDGELIGLLAFWELEHCIFIEHFAVCPERRCGGIGGELLDSFLQQAIRPVVLESEPPETELAARRLGFYRRHGFTVNEGAYIQPPLRTSEPPIPLKLLSYPEPLSNFTAAQETLYREVYRCAESPESLSVRVNG